MVVVGQLGQCPSECTKSAQASFFCLHLLFQCSSEFLVWTPLKTGQVMRIRTELRILWPKFHHLRPFPEIWEYLTLNLTANLTCPSCPYSVCSGLLSFLSGCPTRCIQRHGLLGRPPFWSRPHPQRPWSQRLASCQINGTKRLKCDLTKAQWETSCRKL